MCNELKKKLDYHQDAIENINGKANDLLGKMEQWQDKSPKGKISQPIEGSVRRVHHLKSEDIIGNLIGTEVDFSGTARAIYCMNEQKYIGFRGELFNEFEKIIGLIYSNQRIRKLIKRKWLYNPLMNWFVEKQNGKIDKNCFDFILEKADKSIDENVIAIPIRDLKVKGTVTIRDIKFGNFKKEHFEKWSNAVPSDKMQGEVKKRKENFFTRLEDKYEGRAYALKKVEAEHEKAYEIVKQEVENILIALRITDRNVVQSYYTCSTCQYGIEDIPSFEYFSFSDDIEKSLPTISSGININYSCTIQISQVYINTIALLGFNKYLDILFDENPNEITSRMQKALTLFSRSLMVNSYIDKLVFLIYAYETLFVIGGGEPLKESVSLRAAHCLFYSIQDRIDFRKDYRDAYVDRSGFVHHGKEASENYGLLSRLRFDFIQIIITLYNNRERIHDEKHMKEFFDYLLLAHNTQGQKPFQRLPKN